MSPSHHGHQGHAQHDAHHNHPAGVHVDVLKPSDAVAVEVLATRALSPRPDSECSGSVVGSVIGDSIRSKYSRRVSRRQFSSSRRSSSYKVSTELTKQAETSFMALMGMITSASKECSSLKSVWERIISEREAWSVEREELMCRITEITEEMERKEIEYHGHHGELGEKKKQIEKLKIELDLAIAAVSVEKKRFIECETELGKVRHDLRETRETLTSTTINYEKSKEELKIIVCKLADMETECHTLRSDCERYLKDLQLIQLERTELIHRLSEMTEKYESCQKEVISISERLKVVEIERDESYVKIEEAREEARKANRKAGECHKDYIDVLEKFERASREITKFKETIREVESQRDEYVLQIEIQKRELKELGCRFDETSDKLSEAYTKIEITKRELHSVRESLRISEHERKEQIAITEKLHETVRTLTRERDTLREELVILTKKYEEKDRLLCVEHEHVLKHEETISEYRKEITSLKEKITRIELDRNEYKEKYSHASTEVVDLKACIVRLEAKVVALIESRDSVEHELHCLREEHTKITQTITSFEDESTEYEDEIESLRVMLREAREQKEEAIRVRQIADRERDEAITRYEAKCRELERFEESSMHSHAHARSRMVSSGTTVITTTDKSSSGGFSHGHGHSHSGVHKHNGGIAVSIDAIAAAAGGI